MRAKSKTGTGGQAAQTAKAASSQIPLARASVILRSGTATRVVSCWQSTAFGAARHKTRALTVLLGVALLAGRAAGCKVSSKCEPWCT